MYAHVLFNLSDQLWQFNIFSIFRYSMRSHDLSESCPSFLSDQGPVIQWNPGIFFMLCISFKYLGHEMFSVYFCYGINTSGSSVHCLTKIIWTTTRWQRVWSYFFMILSEKYCQICHTIYILSKSKCFFNIWVTFNMHYTLYINFTQNLMFLLKLQ